MSRIALAVEDDLSAAVGRRLLTEALPDAQIQPLFQNGGSGYLRSKLKNFAQFASHQPVVILTDLDRGECAPQLIQKWTDSRPVPHGLLLRVAVREIEAWLLADSQAIAGLFGRHAHKLPENAEEILDPKDRLLQLARRAPRAIREGMVYQRTGTWRQGVEYNAILSEFVRTQWSPARAAGRSDSLRRARIRIRELTKRM